MKMMKLAAALSVSWILMSMAMQPVVAATTAAMCFQTSRVIKAGDVLSEDSVELTECIDDMPGALRAKHRSGLFIAVEDMEAGVFLGTIRPAPSKTIAQGARLLFITVDGPVRIEREVIALESARPGQRLFVQGNDGPPFAVTYQPHFKTGG